MTLRDLVRRSAVPAPWAEGDNIPWHEPGFSARMLREHLSQEHDKASRRSAKIDAQVEWIHTHVLAGRPAQVLDLGCGPGLYAARLAGKGHTCHGVDYSPASIAYARDISVRDGLNCTFDEADLRQAAFGSGYDLAMLLFGEFNVFRPADIRLILHKVRQALNPRGRMLLEVHTFEAVRSLGLSGASWYTSEGGLFLAEPHLCLQEHFWDAEAGTATTRYFVIDAATARVSRYAQTMQAYDDDGYRAVLAECGFAHTGFWPSLVGSPDASQAGLFVILAEA